MILSNSFLSFYFSPESARVCVCVDDEEGVFLACDGRDTWITVSGGGENFSFVLFLVSFLRAPTAIWKRKNKTKKMDTNTKIGGALKCFFRD
jgi:hypothetical protein